MCARYKMNDLIRDSKVYRTSVGGRLIYLAWAILYSPFAIGSCFIYSDWSFFITNATWLQRLSFVPFNVAISGFTAYMFWRALGPGLRFVVSHDGFIYHGMLSQVRYRWSEIERCTTRHQRTGQVFLYVYRKNCHWPKRKKTLDVSGVLPSYHDLFAEFDALLEGRASVIKPDF